MTERSSTLRQGGAALGVIASLIFVGLEIRQNTVAVRGATLQAISDQAFQYSLSQAQDEHWPRIQAFLNDGGSYDDFEGEDRARLYTWLVASTRVMENRYRQLRLGLLDEVELDVGGGRAATAWYRSEFYLAFWRSIEPTGIWSADFVDFMETEVLAIR